MKQPATPKPAPAPAPIDDGLSREEKLAAWVQKNGKLLAIGGGVVALVVLATWFMSASAKRKENFARQQLEQAWGAADAGNIPQASADLQRVATNFAGTDAAFEAALSLNQTRLLAGQTQLAVDDLRRFIGTNPPAQFSTPANMLLGGALENLGKHTEAITAYEAAVASRNARPREGRGSSRGGSRGACDGTEGQGGCSTPAGGREVQGDRRVPGGRGPTG